MKIEFEHSDSHLIGAIRDLTSAKDRQCLLTVNGKEAAQRNEIVTLPYPPPWMDAPTLCEHICISDATLDNWVRQGILPPCRQVGGKRMWKWSEVQEKLEGQSSTLSAADLAERVYHATKQAANG